MIALILLVSLALIMMPKAWQSLRGKPAQRKIYKIKKRKKSK